MRSLWRQMWGLSTQSDAVWVQRCAQSLIRLRPHDDLEQTILTALDLWPICKHLDPVQVARAQAGLFGRVDAGA